jgi:hypothetical protein
VLDSWSRSTELPLCLATSREHYCATHTAVAEDGVFRESHYMLNFQGELDRNINCPISFVKHEVSLLVSERRVE